MELGAVRVISSFYEIDAWLFAVLVSMLYDFKASAPASQPRDRSRSWNVVL
jgi:hypothetical protein